MKFSAAFSVLSAFVVLVSAQDTSIGAVEAAFRAANVWGLLCLAPAECTVT